MKVLEISRRPFLNPQMTVAITSAVGAGGAYDWSQVLALASPGRGAVAFIANTQNDVMIGLATSPGVLDPMYEIVVRGGTSNYSEIRRRSAGPSVCTAPIGLPNPAPGADNPLWVSVDSITKTIAVGFGRTVGVNVIASYVDPNFINAQYICFTGWNSAVSYRAITLCWLPGPTNLPACGSMGNYLWSTPFFLLRPGFGAMSFTATASSDVHVALSSQMSTVDPMYEIVIGGGNNTWTGIRRKSQGTLLASSAAGLLTPGAANRLWVSVDSNTKTIQVGRGDVGQDIILSWVDPNFLVDVECVDFSSWNLPITYSGVKSVALPAPASAALPAKSGVYDWSYPQLLAQPGNSVLTFTANATTDVHIAFSNEPDTVDPMYEIVIGGNSNSWTGIRRKSQGAVVASAPTGLLQPGANNALWVSISKDTKTIVIGRGDPGQDVILSWTDPNFMADVTYFAFSSWGVPVTYTYVRILPSIPSSTLAIPGKTGQYDWSNRWTLPQPGRGAVSFVANATNDVHIAISPVPATSDPMYEIFIGGYGNTLTAIRHKSQGTILKSAPVGLINPGGEVPLWVSIDSTTQTIQVGYGGIGQNILLSYTDPQFISNATYVTFSSWDTPISYSGIRTLPAIGPVNQTSAPTGQYDWSAPQVLPHPGRGAIAFTATCHDGLHLAISPVAHTQDAMYEIVIGDQGGTSSFLRRSQQGPSLAPTAVGLANVNGANPMWVSIDCVAQSIKVGTGTVIGDNIILTYADLGFLSDAQFVSFKSTTVQGVYSNIQTTLVPSPVSTYTLPPQSGKYLWSAQPLQLPEIGRGTVAFTVNSIGDVYIGISSNPGTTNPMYEFVFGGAGKNVSVLRHVPQGTAVNTANVGLPNPGQDSPLWLSIDKLSGFIVIGSGDVGQNIIMSWCDPSFLATAQYVTLSNYNAPATFSNVRILPAAGLSQAGWCLCNKCQGMFYSGVSSACPAGATHDAGGSLSYSLYAYNRPDNQGQHGWRWCKKCSGLFYALLNLGKCPKDNGVHDSSASADYVLTTQENALQSFQQGWRYCKNCQGLFYSSDTASRCPSTGAAHDGTASGAYEQLYVLAPPPPTTGITPTQNTAIDGQINQLIAQGFQFAVYGVSIQVPFVFTGNTATQITSDIVRWSGTAQIGGPFSGAVGTLTITLDRTKASNNITVRVDVPLAVADMIANQINPHLPQVAQAVINLLLALPIIHSFDSPSVVAAYAETDDPTLGPVNDGINFYQTRKLNSITPFDIIDAQFPMLGLSTCNVVPHLGLSRDSDNGKLKCACDFTLMLDKDLIPNSQFLNLKTIGLHLEPEEDKFEVSIDAKLLMTLSDTEKLDLSGGITVVTGTSDKVTIYGALDTDTMGGAWKEPFGIKGLAIKQFGVEIGVATVFPFIVLGARGEASIGGDDLLSAAFGILFDPSDWASNVLSITSVPGIDLMKLLRAMVNQTFLSFVTSWPIDVALTNLNLYLSPKGGTIAGKKYPAGAGLSGTLNLWGYGINVEGQVDFDNGGYLYGAMGAIYGRYNGTDFIKLTDSQETGGGPNVHLDFNSQKQGGTISGKLALLGGLYKSDVLGTFGSGGFNLTLDQSACGFYGGAQVGYGNGQFTLSLAPGFGYSFSVLGVNFGIHVTATIGIQASATQFSQSISFSFDAFGLTQTYGPVGWNLPLADVVALQGVFAQFGDAVKNFFIQQIGGGLIQAINWLRDNVFNNIVNAPAQVATLCRAAGAEITTLASGLAASYSLAATDATRIVARDAQEAASILKNGFNMSAQQAADVLNNGLHYASDAVNTALNGAGYAASEVASAMQSAFNWFPHIDFPHWDWW